MSKVATDDDTIMKHISNEEIENLSKIDDIENRIRGFNDDKKKIIVKSSYRGVDNLIKNITNFKTKKIIGYIQSNKFDELSKIDNIDTILEKMYALKNFKKLVDDKFTTLKDLIELIKTSDEELLKELEKIKEEAQSKALKKEQAKKAAALAAKAKQEEQSQAAAQSQEKEAAALAVKTKQEVAQPKSDDKGVHPLFYSKLTEMEAKLPPILGNNSGFVSYNQVADKEFCYKFLYCWLNNPINQTNESVQRVYNDIVDSYSIIDVRLPLLPLSPSINKYNITFDVGFIINVQPLKGGLIPTQKRRKRKKPKKSNHTIKKDRVKTR